MKGKLSTTKPRQMANENLRLTDWGKTCIKSDNCMVCSRISVAANITLKWYKWWATVTSDKVIG